MLKHGELRGRGSLSLYLIKRLLYSPIVKLADAQHHDWLLATFYSYKCHETACHIGEAP